jgi:D-alanine-D-alanine ligase-like ATP-grasp enzyme
VDCGLLTPAWRVVRTEREASIGSRLGPPVMVKPLLEGSSIGIPTWMNDFLKPLLTARRTP